MNIPINPNAPVKSLQEISIDAPVSIVWDLLTRITEWPDWQKSVHSARLHAELSEGTSFTWKASNLTFNSKIHTISPLSRFGWTGVTVGVSAIHNWRIETLNGKTVVVVEESLEGLLPKFFPKFFQRNLETGIQTSLKELKTAAEKASRARANLPRE